MTRHNCPNCGAPIESIQCPYCGTVFYDFTVMDSETPTYIRMNWYGQQIVFRALMRSVDITTYSNSSPVYFDEHYKIVESRARNAMDAVIEFMILPDDDGVFMKRTELKGENGCQST